MEAPQEQPKNTNGISHDILEEDFTLVEMGTPKKTVCFIFRFLAMPLLTRQTPNLGSRPSLLSRLNTSPQLPTLLQARGE